MEVLKEIIKIFYPLTCGICGQKINERYTCRKCLNIIEYYHERVVISANLEHEYYDKIISSIQYKGVLKEKMLHYKFHGAKYLGACFAEILAVTMKKYSLNADVIIAVPISKQRLRERGYNQSDIMARHLSKFSGIAYQENILIKTKNNLRQSELALHERKENVKDAYSIKNIEKIKDKKIILIDDIFTTGSTLNECAKVLKRHGASEVIALTVMYGKLEK